MNRIGYLLLILASISLASCISSSSLNANNRSKLPTQEEINNSDLYYDMVNMVFEYFVKEKKKQKNELGVYEFFVHTQVSIQTWNCHLYQKRNFLYHHSYVDTTYENLNIGISLTYLTNVCKALHNPFELSKDISKYNYPIKWSNQPYTNYHTKYSPYFFAPVIKGDDNRYYLWVAKYDWEGGQGEVFTFNWEDNTFILKGNSYDPMDGFGCWSEEDYVRKLCNEGK